MANKKSGLTTEEREKFLHEHGFIQVRDGKGSHTMWQNPTLKLLADSKQYHIAMPVNLQISSFQKPWDLPMCNNPASGTWHRITKQVEWCTKTIENLAHHENQVSKYKDIKMEFKKAVKEHRDWVKKTRHAYKAGVDMGLIPNAPREYEELSGIIEKHQKAKKSFSLNNTFKA